MEESKKNNIDLNTQFMEFFSNKKPDTNKDTQ